MASVYGSVWGTTYLAVYGAVGSGVAPTDGVVSPRMSRVAVGREDRSVTSPEMSRTVWAKARETVQ